MILPEAIDELKSTKTLIEYKLKLIELGSPLKIVYLEEAKKGYLATIDKLSSLTLETENAELSLLKSDVSVLYTKVCSLLEEAKKAEEEVKPHDTTPQQVVLREGRSQASPVAVPLTDVTSASEAVPLTGSTSLDESRAKKPTSTDITLSYAKKLINHSKVQEFGFEYLLSASERWKTYDFSREYLLRRNFSQQVFDLGRQHASPLGKKGGVWFDPYGREGILPNSGAESSLAYLTCRRLFDQNNFEYLYSYDMQPVIEEYKKKYDFFAKLKFRGTIDIDGNLLGLVIVPKFCVIKNFLHFLGGIGALPSRDIMLQLYTRNFFSLSESIAIFSKRMSFRLQQKVVFDGEPLDLMPINDPSILRDLESAKGLDSIITELEQCLESSSLEMNKFYYLVTLNLVKGIKEIYSQEDPHLILVVNRISDLISMSKSSDYSEFLECISLIWDELRWLSKPKVDISPFPSIAYPVKQKLYGETITALKVYSEFISDYPPAHATLGSSGMNVLVQSIHNALKELTFGEKKAAIRYGKNNYFEIRHFLEQYIPGCLIPIGSEATIYTDGDKDIVKPDDWPDGLVTLYIDIPFANIQLDAAGYKYTHVNDFIEEQLKLREQLVDPPPLICILDTTVGYSNDVFIKWTLTQFHDAIEKGKLYIFFAHSLNKAWTMGLDKGCAGFCHQYGNLDYFPRLKYKIEQDATTFNLGGQPLTGSTVSFIKLIMSSCPDFIDRYGENLRFHSRFVHQSILKSLIGSKENYIVIDEPESYPAVKDSSEPLMELADVSTFVNIRINEAYPLDKNFSSFFGSCATLLLNDVGIIARDGYGFAETIFTFLYPENKPLIIRISIGSESPEELALRFNRIKDFIVKFNQIIGKYFPLIYGQSECKDPDIKLIALREIVENFISQYPEDDHLPLVREKIEAIFQLSAARYIEESRERKANQKFLTTADYRQKIRDIQDKPSPTAVLNLTS